MVSTVLELTNAGKAYGGGRRVLSAFDFRLSSGELVVVLGRSGSGKSTLIKVLAGLENLDEGTVTWQTDSERPKIGVVFQQPALIPWLSVRENIALGARFGATSGRFDFRYAASLLERFGLEVFADRYPDELSGGQAQRVAVIRAAAIQPDALLLDEPFSALDPAVRSDCQEWLAELSKELGCSVVLVTHDVDEALRLGDRIVLLGPDGSTSREWRLNGALQTETTRTEILAEYREDAVEDAHTGKR